MALENVGVQNGILRRPDAPKKPDISSRPAVPRPDRPNYVLGATFDESSIDKSPIGKFGGMFASSPDNSLIQTQSQSQAHFQDFATSVESNKEANQRGDRVQATPYRDLVNHNAEVTKELRERASQGEPGEKGDKFTQDMQGGVRQAEQMSSASQVARSQMDASGMHGEPGEKGGRDVVQSTTYSGAVGGIGKPSYVPNGTAADAAYYEGQKRSQAEGGVSNIGGRMADAEARKPEANAPKDDYKPTGTAADAAHYEGLKRSSYESRMQSVNKELGSTMASVAQMMAQKQSTQLGE